jgi:hypothetical protein
MLFFQLRRRSPTGVVFCHPGTAGCLVHCLVIMIVPVVGGGAARYAGDAWMHWPAAVVAGALAGHGAAGQWTSGSIDVSISTARDGVLPTRRHSVRHSRGFPPSPGQHNPGDGWR